VDARRSECRWCWRVFVVCRACDRGQAYCEDEACRRGAHREANDRHQRSDEGRADHRDRMEASRQQKTRPVTDDHSDKLPCAGSVVGAATDFMAAPEGPADDDRRASTDDRSAPARDAHPDDAGSRRGARGTFIRGSAGISAARPSVTR